MTSAPRLISTARRTLPQPTYACLQRRLQPSITIGTTRPSITLTYAPRRHATWVDTDKLRKKIWGTDDPPGQEDPYEQESVSDRTGREREQENAEGKGLESAPEREEAELQGRHRYAPATTTEGLKRVPHWKWERAEWMAEHPFQGFMDPLPIAGWWEVGSAVHRALVETYVLKDAGLPLVMDYYSLDPSEDYAKRVAQDAKFMPDANGMVVLVTKSRELRKAILECVTPKERNEGAIEETETDEEEVVEQEVAEQEIEEQEAEAKGAEETPLEAVMGDEDINLEPEESEEAMMDEKDPYDVGLWPNDTGKWPNSSGEWRNVPLEDAAIKFAVLKRVMQLTGQRIADPAISTISTSGSLIAHLIKKSKPIKIAKALKQSEPVVGLGNVEIFDRRFGWIDRENEVGRWKVMQLELEKRGLPVSHSKMKKKKKKKKIG